MSCLSWNCQGLGNPWTIRALGEMLYKYKPQLLFLMETRMGDFGIEKVKNKFNLFGICVPAIGKSGGLALLWNKSVSLSIINYSRNHIDANVQLDDSEIIWRFTGFYGEPEVSKRKGTWKLLNFLGEQSHREWLVIGDFNEITRHSEKLGGNRTPEWRLNDFRKTLLHNNLVDLGFKGYPYAWNNNREHPRNTQVRLDRAVASVHWLNIFPQCQVSHITTRRSDHNAILLNTQKAGPRLVKAKRRFRFESMWLRADGCGQTVTETWSNEADTLDNLDNCKVSLMDWSCNQFGHVKSQMRKTSAELEELQQQPQVTTVRDRIRAIKQNLEELLDREELMWKQRAKVQWLAEGDRNTRFFHSQASKRSSGNQIRGLRDHLGAMQNTTEKMGEIANNYFTTIFDSRQPSEEEIEDVVSTMRATVDHSINRDLARVFTPVEVKAALFSMYPTKSPGPDGMPALFFQKFWHIVGANVTKCVLAMLNNHILNPKLNYTHIILIPKCQTPESITQFRPISLSNVVFKIASKAITARLKPHMHKIIAETQSAFVPSRLITDNVLVSYEVNHFLKRKTKGKEVFMALKLDMSKAYDRVEWPFLLRVLQKLGFEHSFVKLIMLCVTTVSYSINLNGELSDRFKPNRGIRQGDPLSPYLFLFCSEAFSSLIVDAERREVLKGIAVSPGAPRISHLLFADDTLIFCESNRSSALEIMDILHRYSLASGQIINLEKSTVVFSKNADREKVDLVKECLPVAVVEKHEKYLGLPTTMGRSKKEVFGWIRERVWEKTQGFGEKCLSKAGKEVLVKAVLQAIPTYVMGCFKLPKYLINEIESITSKFWWGDKGNRKIHWVKWDTLCNSKRDGGLGFRDLGEFNLAMLGKQIWRIIQYPDSLLSRVLKAKYFPFSSVFEAAPGFNSSFTWKSICSALPLVSSGTRWRIGSGEQVKIWDDNWIPRDSSARPFTPDLYDLGDISVSNLINQQARCWDTSLLETLFWTDDVEAIRRIPLGGLENVDVQMWHFSKNGQYSVKSAYHQARRLTKLQSAAHTAGSSTHHQEIDTVWDCVWALPVPNKIKIFWWRALRNALPVAQNLVQRHVPIDELCQVCKTSSESILHVLKSCHYARLYWALSPFRSGSIQVNAIDVWDWFKQVKKGCSKQNLAQFAVCCWTLWYNRNCIVHKNELLDPLEAVGFSTDYLHRFEQARIQFGNPRPPERNQIWEAPAHDYIKINVDASISSKQNGAGIGMVARNRSGQILAWRRRRILFIQDPECAEAMAASQGIDMAIEFNWRKVVLEGDCYTVISSLKSCDRNLSNAGIFIAEARTKIGNFDSIVFHHIGREGNTIAHTLARNVQCNSDDVPTVSETKANFLQAYKRPIPSIYNTVLQELIVQQHLMRYKTTFSYDAVFALGFLTVYDRLMEGYPSDEVREAIFRAYIKALQENPEQYRCDAQKLEEWARAQTAGSLFDFSSKEGDVETILKDISERAGGKGSFSYSRFFAIGLFRLLELANVTEPTVLEKVASLLRQTKVWAGSRMNIDKRSVDRDLDVYRNLLTKLVQAKELLKEYVDREKKKVEERTGQQKANEAVAKCLGEYQYIGL